MTESDLSLVNVPLCNGCSLCDWVRNRVWLDGPHLLQNCKIVKDKIGSAMRYHITQSAVYSYPFLIDKIRKKQYISTKS